MSAQKKESLQDLVGGFSCVERNEKGATFRNAETGEEFTLPCAGCSMFNGVFQQRYIGEHEGHMLRSINGEGLSNANDGQLFGGFLVRI